MAVSASCVVNNYNYAQFLPEALESVFAQTLPFDEIIVVDDCSTDESRKLLLERYGADPRIRLILKDKNEGQLSAFNEGIAVATGDLIFFLDADDRYFPAYLHDALEFYESHRTCDFLFCGISFFGQRTGVEHRYPRDTDLGYSTVITLFGKKGEAYIGSATSTISMRMKVAAKLFPLPLNEDWRTRADDCLVWGASIAGARKYYLAKHLVEYRIHSSNSWAGKKFLPTERYVRELAILRLRRHLMNRNGLSDSVVKLAYLEFRTIPRPTFRQMKSYCRIISCSGMPFLDKICCIISNLAHFTRTARKVSVHD